MLHKQEIDMAVSKKKTHLHIKSSNHEILANYINSSLNYNYHMCLPIMLTGMIAGRGRIKWLTEVES